MSGIRRGVVALIEGHFRVLPRGRPSRLSAPLKANKDGACLVPLLERRPCVASCVSGAIAPGKRLARFLGFGSRSGGPRASPRLHPSAPRERARRSSIRGAIRGRIAPHTSRSRAMPRPESPRSPSISRAPSEAPMKADRRPTRPPRRARAPNPSSDPTSDMILPFAFTSPVCSLQGSRRRQGGRSRAARAPHPHHAHLQERRQPREGARTSSAAPRRSASRSRAPSACPPRCSSSPFASRRAVKVPTPGTASSSACTSASSTSTPRRRGQADHLHLHRARRRGRGHHRRRVSVRRCVASPRESWSLHSGDARVGRVRNLR